MGRSLVDYQFFVVLPSLPIVVQPIIKNPLLFGGLSLLIQIARCFSDYAIIVKRIPEIVELHIRQIRPAAINDVELIPGGKRQGVVCIYGNPECMRRAIVYIVTFAEFVIVMIHSYSTSVVRRFLISYLFINQCIGRIGSITVHAEYYDE